MKQKINKWRPGLFRRVGIALAIGQLFASPAWAEDAAISELKSELAKSIKQIESLTARLNELENKAKQGGGGTDAERLAAVERDVAQLADSKNRAGGDTGIPVHGFADVGFVRSSKNETRITQAGKGFQVGSLDFYLTPKFGDRAKALIELIFEMGADGGLATDLERVQFGYTFNDKLTGWLGRFHTPYGYWNTGFHHGAQIQTSILRPRFIDFEDKGGLLPAHLVGGWATGQTPVGGGKLTYDLFMGNGGAIDVDTAVDPRGTLAINNTRDSNGNTLFGANVGYRYGNGLTLGVHGFTERVNIRDAAVGGAQTGEVGVQMTGLYGFYDNNDWEGIAEYYHFNNENLSGNNCAATATCSNKSWLVFGQVGKAIGDWMPYVRAEKAVLDQNDLYFNSQQYGVSYTRQALGVRYNLNAKSALKLEANRTNEGDGTPATGANSGQYSEARLQYSIRF
ncbi:MAG: hypothetical protein AB1513_00055 [Pseudomonadota bacterium]